MSVKGLACYAKEAPLSLFVHFDQLLPNLRTFLLPFFPSLLFMRSRVNFVVRILRFEEVHKLEHVGRRRHPFRGIRRVKVFRQTELFETSVGDVHHVLVHVVGVEAQDAVRKEVFVVIHLQIHAFDDDVSDLGREVFGQKLSILLEDVQNKVDAELEVERFVAQYPVDHRTEVSKLVSLTERKHDHEARIEPRSLHHDVVCDEVSDEVLFAVDGLDVERGIRHALQIFHDIGFFRLHRRKLEVGIVYFFAVERERFEDVFERHAVIRLFPHLFCDIEMTLRRFEVRIDAESEGTVDDELGRVKERHDEFDRMALVFGHLCPIFKVFFEGDLVRKPRVSDGLSIEVVRPLVFDRMEINVFWGCFSYE